MHGQYLLGMSASRLYMPRRRAVSDERDMGGIGHARHSCAEVRVFRRGVASLFSSSRQPSGMFVCVCACVCECVALRGDFRACWFRAQGCRKEWWQCPGTPAAPIVEQAMPGDLGLALSSQAPSSWHAKASLARHVRNTLAGASTRRSLRDRPPQVRCQGGSSGALALAALTPSRYLVDSGEERPPP